MKSFSMAGKLNQKYIYQTRLTLLEIEESVKQLFTETLDFNKEKFSGYFDVDYFKLVDNESYKLGKPALIEGRIIRKVKNKAIIELTVRPTHENITSIILGVLMLVMVVLGFLLFDVTYPALTHERVALLCLSIVTMVIGIRSVYYSSKKKIIEVLELEKCN